MKTPQISILAIALAAGCAHHAEASRTNAHAHSQHPQARMADGTNAPVVADAPADRVAVPNHEPRKQLATAGHELPADRPKADQPPVAGNYGADPNNTRVNERDRAAGALTPMDQSESAEDRELVQRIRKAVIADDSLSFTAKNVKIITRDGRVTLRGPVVNAHEKTAIEQAARNAAGSKGVTNDLEISN
jgi:hypothetical protein